MRPGMTENISRLHSIRAAAKNAAGAVLKLKISSTLSVLLMEWARLSNA